MDERDNNKELKYVDILCDSSLTLSLLVASFVVCFVTVDNLCKQFGPRQAQQNVGPDLHPNCLTLIIVMVFLKDFLKKLILKKKSQTTKSMQNSSACKELKWTACCFYIALDRLGSQINSFHSPRYQVNIFLFLHKSLNLSTPEKHLGEGLLMVHTTLVLVEN